MPKQSTVADVDKPETSVPVVTWNVEVEATDYVNGKVPTKTILKAITDEYLVKMEGLGWTGYAVVTKFIDGKKDEKFYRAMHVSAPQCRDLFALRDAGEEPIL